MDGFVGKKGLIKASRLREFTPRSDLRGAIQIGSHFGAILVTGVGLWFAWGSWWAVPIFVLHGMLINYLYAGEHELSHNTVFRTRKLNEWFGRLIGFLMIYPRTWDQLSHFAHHRHTQEWDKDPELLARPPFRLGNYLVYLSGITYWIARVRRLLLLAAGHADGWWLNDAQKAEVVREGRWHLLGYLAIAGVSFALESWAAVIFWLAPMLATKALHQVQNITEHTGVTHERDMVKNTRTIETWPILKWMAWNMQYHTAHHSFPGVPFFRLPELHEEISRHLDFKPPTTGYIAFQVRFIGRLLRGPEPVDGVSEVEPLARA